MKIYKQKLRITSARHTAGRSSDRQPDSLGNAAEWFA